MWESPTGRPLVHPISCNRTGIGAVAIMSLDIAITGASFLWFPESYNLPPRAAAAMERIRAIMGPVFSRMAHHGQQRVLLTQGQAYARMGRMEEARACFDQGLAVNPTSVEGELIRAELGTLAARSARPRE
jgi:hypothetical protein